MNRPIISLACVFAILSVVVQAVAGSCDRCASDSCNCDQAYPGFYQVPLPADMDPSDVPTEMDLPVVSPETADVPLPDFNLDAQSVAFASSGGGIADQQMGGLATVGNYIDDALIRSRFRFRYDRIIGWQSPERAEYVMPFAAPFGRATLPSPDINTEEFRGYVEIQFQRWLSIMGETSARLVQNATAVDPFDQQLIDSQRGGGDGFVGFKLGLINQECRQLTAQVKGHIPLGDPQRCLGTGHAALEAGLLYQTVVAQRWQLFGEVQDWIAFDASRAPAALTAAGQFAGELLGGNVLRYGLGTSYDVIQRCDCGVPKRLSAVTEFVGWSVLEGAKFDFATNTIVDASSDTIVNGKFGLRYQTGPNAFAASYGTNLTDERWYDDILRFEFNRFF